MARFERCLWIWRSTLVVVPFFFCILLLLLLLLLYEGRAISSTARAWLIKLFRMNVHWKISHAVTGAQSFLSLCSTSRPIRWKTTLSVGPDFHRFIHSHRVTTHQQNKRRKKPLPLFLPLFSPVLYNNCGCLFACVLVPLARVCVWGLYCTWRIGLIGQAYDIACALVLLFLYVVLLHNGMN